VKGLVFPEVKDTVFQMGNFAASVLELREFLKGGVDFFSGEQNWFWVGTDEEEEMFVKVLPAPFNDIDAYVELTWSSKDVVFDAGAQLLLGLHDRAFSELELQRLSVGELQVIRAVKGAGSGGSKKKDLIDAILSHQKSVRQSAVRVVQSKLLEVSM